MASRVVGSVALLLLVAIGAHEIWLLLKPLVPALVSFLVLAIVLWIIVRRRW